MRTDATTPRIGRDHKPSGGAQRERDRHGVVQRMQRHARQQRSRSLVEQRDGEIIGHDDGGYLISTVYTKLGQRRALSRAQRAMAAYQQRQDAADTERPHLQIATAA